MKYINVPFTAILPVNVTLRMTNNNDEWQIISLEDTDVSASLSDITDSFDDYEWKELHSAADDLWQD